MNEEMRVEAMELCVTACEKHASSNEVSNYCSPTLFPPFPPLRVCSLSTLVPITPPGCSKDDKRDDG